LLLVINCALKKQTRQLKKIVLETMNFGSKDFTKPKKKPRNTTKYHNIFTISFFPAMVGLGLVFYFFTSTIFSKQILSDKLLLVLNWNHHFKLCIKNKNKKTAQENYA